jgi:hypothetical protein
MDAPNFPETPEIMEKMAVGRPFRASMTRMTSPPQAGGEFAARHFFLAKGKLE